jgi:DnaJ-class molecular chaperone
MKEYLIEIIKELRQVFFRKSVCGRCKGSGDLLLVCGIKEDCPKCDGSGVLVTVHK